MIEKTPSYHMLLPHYCAIHLKEIFKFYSTYLYINTFTCFH